MMELHNNEIGQWVCSCCGGTHRREEWIASRYGPITEWQHRTSNLMRQIYSPLIERQLRDEPFLR